MGWLMSTIQAEKDYRWLDAAKSYEQEITSQTNTAIIPNIWQTAILEA